MTAPNGEGQSFAATGPQDQTKTDSPDSASSSVAARKRFEHVRALLALHHGHVVHELASGGYLVTWRGLSRECADLDPLEAHALRVGALR